MTNPTPRPPNRPPKFPKNYVKDYEKNERKRLGELLGMKEDNAIGIAVMAFAIGVLVVGAIWVWS